MMMTQRPILRKSMNGAQVIELQQNLQELGFQVTVDANFEEETYAKVKELQS